MYKCTECDKTFETTQALGGHLRIHKNRIKPTFSCLNCGVTKQYSPSSSQGKYCSNRCQVDHNWTIAGRQKIVDGKGGNGVWRYLTEEYGYKCSECDISSWNDKKITLHVDHIDGNSDNNDIDNLRYLCPNCHSQTDTYTGRNKKNTKRNRYLQVYKKEKKQQHNIS